MSDLDDAVDEAMEPQTPRAQLEACLELIEGMAKRGRRLLERGPDYHAEYEKERAVELQEPCEHPDGRIIYRTLRAGGQSMWCLVCGAYRDPDSSDWRLPKRGK